MKVCAVEGCGRPHSGRGYCNAHYVRWRSWGDVRPDLPLKSQGSRGEGIEDRFWRNVDKGGPTPEHRPDLGSCWLWTAAVVKGGNRPPYGRLYIGAAHRVAHRFAYELLVGPIPEDFQVDHLCRVPSCVNPAHLEAVTQIENLRRQHTHLRACRVATLV